MAEVMVPLDARCLPRITARDDSAVDAGTPLQERVTRPPFVAES